MSTSAADHGSANVLLPELFLPMKRARQERQRECAKRGLFSWFDNIVGFVSAKKLRHSRHRCTLHWPVLQHATIVFQLIPRWRFRLHNCEECFGLKLRKGEYSCELLFSRSRMNVRDTIFRFAGQPEGAHQCVFLFVPSSSA